MELRPLTNGDIDLYESILCDSDMMAELGGPLPRKGLIEKLRRDVTSVDRQEAWVFVIVAEPDIAAGTVSVWRHEVRGDPVTEIGWMVLPRHQGQRLGSAAVREVLDRVREDGRWGVLHAFPPVTNDRSNAMCRKMGFSPIGERDFVYAGRTLRCNEWRLDLDVAALPRR